MTLGTRGLPFEIPKYSLTGDVLSFRRCGLQYRYYNGSSLPPSRPVQLWTGEFVHGVLEEAYLHWQVYGTPFPWPCHPTPWPAPVTLPVREPYDVGVLGDLVETRLRAAGKIPRNTEARDAAYRRVNAVLRRLAPYLFPLIDATEERISGTREMPAVPGGLEPRGDRYELTGVVDVISHISLATHWDNPLTAMIAGAVAGLPGSFDVIVDYKAARRPPVVPLQGSNPHWDLEAWQVQTYAWLRRHQPGTNPIGAGIVVYVNELSPSQTDLLEYMDEIAQDRTDVVPPRGSADYYALHRWRRGVDVPTFSAGFLLQRAVRIVGATPMDVDQAVNAIDEVVAQIELCALRENATGLIPGNWPTTGDEQDCDPCDFKRFCRGTARMRAAGGDGGAGAEGSNGAGRVRPPGAPG
ncbi:MAG: PD-(D/E)XK nuclease family protein [Bacillota bacterium]